MGKDKKEKKRKSSSSSGGGPGPAAGHDGAGEASQRKRLKVGIKLTSVPSADARDQVHGPARRCIHTPLVSLALAPGPPVAIADSETRSRRVRGYC